MMDVRFLDEEAARRKPTASELRSMGLTRKEFEMIEDGIKAVRERKFFPRIKEPDLWKDGDYDEF